ncbi:MAG TPA: secretin [Firmicutes bacterium]|nr:secretin [Bacillota bacterium]
MQLRLCLWALVLVFFVGGVGFAQEEEEPLVNIMFFETDLREALNEISLQTGVTIIADQTVSGQVTADLQDVPLEKALRMILFTGGLSFRKVDDYYIVGLPDPRNTTFSALVETEIVRLSNVTVQEVMDQLPTFLTSYVRGTPDRNLLTISAPPLELERIKELIRQIDTPRRTVEIQVLVTEVSSQALKELGNSLLQFSAEKGQSVGDSWYGRVEYDGNVLTLSTNIWGELVTELKMLEQKQEARIHADPRVIVADRETAELFVGDLQILPISSENEETTRIERVEVGVVLEVTPTILPDDQILLKLAPEVSHFVSEARPDLVVKRNSVSTTVRLANGQTAVLAGMTMQDFYDLSRKVPILGDIPIIRWLFRNDVKREGDREVLIFVTPVIQ